jgi:hypothetical protein
MSLFTTNYLDELPDDIKAIIYSHVYKSRYSSVLKELLANIRNRKHYNNLMHFLAYQGEPKLNLVHYLAHYINVHNIRESRRGHTEDSIISLYKKHLTSVNIANHRNINKIKIPLNLYTYLDKVIAKTFISFMKKTTHSWNIASHIHIDNAGDIILALEHGKHFACFADLYLILLSFWQFIRSRLYEFYELHKEAYNIHIHNLLKCDYDTGLYIWFGGNITDEILANNLVKMKNENASLYRKIIRQRRNIYKTECLYINFEIRNNIEGYTVEDDAIIIRLKEI